MSDNSISFKVNDVGVSSFIDKLKTKSSELTSEMIKDAQKQTSVAKEQIKLVEEKIKALERQTKLESQSAQDRIRDIANQRVGTATTRIDALESKNKERLRTGEIDKDEYLARKKKIGQLRSDYSQESIQGGADEQIQQLKEQARQTQELAAYMKEVVNSVRNTSQAEINAIKQGDEKLIDAVEETDDPQKRLANQLASQQVNQERDKEKKTSKPEDKSQWLEFAKALTFEKVGGMVANLPNAKNELDYVKPIMSMMGMMMGGLAGNLINAMNVHILGSGLGETQFGALGQQFGEKMGEFAGNAIERSYRGRDELTVSNYRLRAISGNRVGEVDGFGKKDADGNNLGGTGEIYELNQNLSKYGVSMKEVSQLQYDLSMRKGGISNVGRDSENTLAMQQGWGVRQETSMAMFEMMRSNREGDKNIQNIIAGVLQKGGSNGLFTNGDRTYLNEFLTRNYIQLQKQLLQTQSSVSSGTSFDILSKFNSLGAEYGVKDSRSSGLLNTIQSSLANPGSDSMKALSFYVMRQQNPNMNLADTGIEIQKGLGSPAYLQSMMKYLTSMGGDESYQTYNVASAFGLNNNLEAAQRLLRGYKSGKLGSKFDVSKLMGTGEYSENEVRSLGEQQTSTYSKSTAEIDNAFVKGAKDGVELVGKKMFLLFGDMIDQMKVYIREEIKKQLVSDTPAPNPKVDNVTYKSKDKKLVTGGIPGYVH